MATRTSFQTLVTPAPRTHDNPLLKRSQSATVCGGLQGGYPNIQAPVCGGATSICTFSQGLQGCCDSDNSCQFYTTCIGHYDPAMCTGSQCLGCTDTAPYCIKYNFWGERSQTGFDGYSCGIFQDTSTIFGVATSSPVSTAAETTFWFTSSGGSPSSAASSAASSGASASLTASASPSAAASSSATILSSSSLTATTSVSSTMPTSGPTITDSVSALSSPTATGVITPDVRSVSHTGAIVGGILGGFAGLALLGIVSYFVFKKYIRDGASSRHHQVGDTIPEVQQRYDA